MIICKYISYTLHIHIIISYTVHIHIIYIHTLCICEPHGVRLRHLALLDDGVEEFPALAALHDEVDLLHILIAGEDLDDIPQQRRILSHIYIYVL